MPPDAQPKPPEVSSPKPDAATAVFSQWVTGLPTTLINTLNPFAKDEAAGENGHVDKSPPQAAYAKRSSFIAGFLSNPLPSSTGTSARRSPSPVKDDSSVMFAEPDTRSNSEVGSRDGSIDESGRRRSRRNGRPKMRFSVCHPPPASSTRQRLHRRPRSLLQLHTLCLEARPRPAFEVIHSNNFSVTLTKAITRVFKTKYSLSANDLVVLRAEKYSAEGSDEEQEARDIIALIRKSKKEDGAAMGKTQICLPDGREWEACALANGGYEFSSPDEHGLREMVRWWPKKNKDGSRAKDSDKKKFNFSTISPNSRRHPVIACLGRTSLDVNDSYRIPDAANVTPRSTPRQNSTILEDAMQEELGDDVPDLDLRETDDRLRELVVVTGIWVTFKEGWSPNFRYDDKESSAIGIGAVPRSPSIAQHSPSKSTSFAMSPVSSPPASPGLAPVEKRSSIKSVSSGVLRRSSLLRGGNRVSQASVSIPTVGAPETENSTGPQPTSDGFARTGRSRADSASTVLVHRAASNRRKNNQATWRPDLLAAAHTSLPEASSEDLRGAAAAAQAPLPQRAEGEAETSPPPAAAPATEAQDEKRTSNATSTTVGSDALVKPAPAAAAGATAERVGQDANSSSTRNGRVKSPRRKRSTWRKLLCRST